MKKILITGINGFVGKNCQKYFSKNAEVYGIDIIGKSSPKIFIGELNAENINSFGVNFDIIIHLAGTGSVGQAQKNPTLEKTRSVDSCKELLDYVKNFSPNTRIIFSSSASVYGNNYTSAITENSILNPVSIYGEHKLAAENLCKKYADKYNLNIKIIRFFSLYGVECRKQLLWDVLNRIKNLEQKTLPCFGTGDETRDFVNISDAISFIEKVAELGNGFEIYNCGSGKETSVKKVIDLLIKYYGKDIVPIYDNIKRDGNPDTLVADVTKAINIGFIPKIDLEKGIADYVEWFKSL